MSKILGKDVLWQIYIDGMWKPYACGRTVSLETTVEYIETSVSGQGRGRTVLPAATSWGGSFDGVATLLVEDMVTLPELRVLQMSGTRLQMRFQRTDTEGNVYTDSGYIYIQTITDTASFDDMNIYSGTFIGSGLLNQIFVTTPNNYNVEMRYEYTGIGGEFGFTDAALINKYIISFVKDGYGKSKIITSGTPVNNEILYTASTGTFEGAIPFEPGEEAYVTYRSL